LVCGSARFRVAVLRFLLRLFVFWGDWFSRRKNFGFLKTLFPSVLLLLRFAEFTEDIRLLGGGVFSSPRISFCPWASKGVFSVVCSSLLVLLSFPHLWLLCMIRRNACGMRFGSLFFFFSGKCLVRSFVLLAEFPFAVWLSACVSYLLLLVFHLSLATTEHIYSGIILQWSDSIAAGNTHTCAAFEGGERFKLLEVEARETTISQCWLSWYSVSCKPLSSSHNIWSLCPLALHRLDLIKCSWKRT